jgi:hypothetical protein
MIKHLRSIDGYFNQKINIINFSNKNKKIFNNYNTVLGEGNSISQLPFLKKTKLIKPVNVDSFFLDKKHETITVNGNSKITDVHNFLLKKKYYCHYFPSYPSVTIGGCIANGTHGIIPKNGIFTDFVVEVKLFNPNFGTKILSNLKNKELFELTKCGFGLTGIILEAKIKIFKLRSTKVLIKSYDFKNLFQCYKFIKKSKSFYNQNTFTVDYKKKDIFTGRLLTGSFYGKKCVYRKINNKKIFKFRLGLFRFNWAKNIIFNFNFFLDKILTFVIKTKHINDVLFTSNNKTSYFNLMPNKFIEYQNIIPNKNVKIYLSEFEKILRKYEPKIALVHLKQFDQNGKNFEFKKKGLAIAMHIIVDDKFNSFYKKLIDLDYKYNCLINLYKNSLIDISFLKKFYPNYFYIFKNKINKINKKYKFTNSIFKNYT